MKHLMIRTAGILLGVIGLYAPVGAIELPPMTTQAANPAAESTTMTASVNALMVYGEDKFQMKSQKTMRVLTKNVNEPVASLLDIPLNQVFSFSPDDEVFSRSLGSGARLRSDRVLRPLFLSRIPVAPFVEIQPAPEGGKSFATWTFKVTDGAGGALIFQQKGTAANLPTWLTWDGCDANHKPVLEPGKKYAWLFTAYNRAGKRIQAQKRTILFWTLIYDRGRDRNVVIATQRLFKPDSLTQLSGAGKKILDDTSDYYRESGADRLELVISSDAEEPAADRGRVLSNYLARCLLLEEDRIRTRVEALSKNGIGKVEIRFTRNR